MQEYPELIKQKEFIAVMVGNGSLGRDVVARIATSLDIPCREPTINEMMLRIDRNVCRNASCIFYNKSNYVRTNSRLNRSRGRTLSVVTIVGRTQSRLGVAVGCKYTKTIQ